MRRSYVDTPRGQVHLRRAGSGPQTVLLLHQTASSSAMFEALAEVLLADGGEERWTLVAPDTPGFGMSFVPDGPYDLDAWADDMAAVLDAVADLADGTVAGRAPAAHVVGHHTGAAVAICLAHRHPERVVTLTMIGALVLADDERAAWTARIRGMDVRPSGAHLAEAWWQVATIDGDPTAYPPGVDLQHREVVDKLHAGRRWHEAYRAVFATDLGARLAATTVPALLISGEADVLHRYVPTTVAARPGVTLVELAAGAYVLDQEPSLVARPLTVFLAAHPAGSWESGREKEVA